MAISVQAKTETEAQADAARHAYSQKIAATYNWRFGKNEPFLPSNAKSITGEFISPQSFPAAEYCGHCHQETYHQWRQTAHANSFRAPWYIKNVNMMMKEKGIEYSRHCEGCHNPIALMSGVLTEKGTTHRPFDQDGITCSVCHSIQKVTTRGTGSYVMGIPAVLVDAQGRPITRPVSDAEILTHLDRHDQAVMKDFYRTSEFCAACHKAALPHELNDYKWLRAFTVYDEWQNTSFAKESPLPFYKKDTVSTCQTCHMPTEKLVGKDYGAVHDTLVSHRWLGANTLIPKYYHYPEQFNKTVAFLKNGAFNIDIFALETQPKDTPVSGTPNLVAPLGTVPFSLAAGQTVTVSVVIQNKGIGHSHVPEQRDFYESWVKFTAKNAAGHTIVESGFLKPDGSLDPRAHSFTNRLINVHGTLNDLHQVWDNRVVAYNNTIQSGRSQVVRYRFRIPEKEKGPITITASVEYRRFDQHFISFVMGKGYVEPVVQMASASRVLYIGKNHPTAPGPDENKLWMRWNNYGIAMLDAQQYASSVDAFEHMAQIRPDYPDAYTNIAIAQIQWEKYTDARPNLMKSLALAPDNARALYYLALVERNEGNLDLTISDLKKVAQQFPRSRDAHRELGFSYYQEHKYDLARDEYLKVQGIDPDDLSAHYNLAILYRRLGIKDKAAEESAMFADQKNDPTASTYALEFLRKHTDIATESIAWHTHDLEDQQQPAKSPVSSTTGTGSR
ncbi:MAG: multiheme c-type cytochrome [Acidobacteriaceae bacterium]